MPSSDQSQPAGRLISSRRRFLQRGAVLTASAAAAMRLGTTGLHAQIVVVPARLATGSSRAAQSAPPPADPQMQEVLDALAALGVLPFETLTPPQARNLPGVADAVQGVLAKHGQAPAVEAVGAINHIVVPGGPGSDGSLARVYMPISGRGPFPVLVYFHGGGWVIGNLDAYDASCRALANAAGCVVMSVAYRLAPENKFPAAVDDAYAAYQWAVSNAGLINGDPTRVAVGGESAGGNLAAVTAVQARDTGIQLPVHQLLIYPVTDSDLNRPSDQENADAKPLSKAALVWFYGYYLRDAADYTDPRFAVLRTPDLTGLPPATVILDQIDPLRSEGEAYAARLSQADVPTTLQIYNGVTHEFFYTAAVVDQAKRAQALAAAGLRASFGTAAFSSALGAQRPAAQ